MDLHQLTDEVETVSRLYARRNDIERNDSWFLLKLNEEVGELTQAYLMRTGQARHKGRSQEEIESDFRAEVADVLAQVLLTARHFGLDPEAEIERKWLVWNPDWSGRAAADS
jgi:NTP pyrophosphatase (non-canonical NTP hydrolase)